MEAVKAVKNLRQQAEQPSNLPVLSSYQTRQRPLQEMSLSRATTVELANLVKFTFFFLHRHGQDRNLGGPPQSGRTTADFNVIARSKDVGNGALKVWF